MWNGACFPVSLRSPGEITGQGMGSPCPEGGVDEISIIALKCSQDETFLMMNSKVPPFRIPFVEGVEEKCGVVVSI